MKKRYKLLVHKGKIHILHWKVDGVLFGPVWEPVATFDECDDNIESCKTIIRLMNKCDKHINHRNDD